MTIPFYQIGWSDTHRRDIRLEVTGSMSAPLYRLVRYLPTGDMSYLNLMEAEAARLYNALGQALAYHIETKKLYVEPDHGAWELYEQEDDDSLSSD